MSGPRLAAFATSAGHQVGCELCPHACVLSEGETGLCGVRHARAGQLWTSAYGGLFTAQAAPLERKFLFHVAPGSLAWSYGLPGCNLRCGYCQNWMVSQAPKGGTSPGLAETTPAEVVAAALAAGCRAVAATYTEPTIFIEFALDVARLARAAGLLNVWKTNGFIAPPALAAAAPWLDAVNVDLKAWRDDVWQERLGGAREPVLAALRAYRDAGVWVEVTSLLLPDQLDDWRELDALADWLLVHLGPNTPWHLNRFHPDFALAHLSPTPRERLAEARERALARGFQHVYCDAWPAGPGWDTACSGCGAVLLERAEYRLTADHRHHQVCPACGRAAAYVGG